MRDWGLIAWAAALGILVVWRLLDARKRARSMSAMANRLGLKMWAGRLPPELSLAGTPIAATGAAWNVMEGTLNGIPVIAFDCRIGSGKGSWCRTVIAARSSRDVFATVISYSSYTVDRSDEWIVFYAPKGEFFLGWRSLMPIAELEARLSSLGE